MIVPSRVLSEDRAIPKAAGSRAVRSMAVPISATRAIAAPGIAGRTDIRRSWGRAGIRSRADRAGIGRNPAGPVGMGRAGILCPVDRAALTRRRPAGRVQARADPVVPDRDRAVPAALVLVLVLVLADLDPARIRNGGVQALVAKGGQRDDRDDRC